MTKINIEEMATFCKTKGFIFPNSDIYGGYAGFFDFGPLGVEMKNTIKNMWWKFIVQDRENVVGIDGTIISNPKVWVASGHVACFEDILVEDKVTNERFRADHIVEDALKIQADGLSAEDLWKLIKENKIKSPKGNELSEPSQFNLMFDTNVGPKVTDNSKSYLRPETAQLIFTNFKLVMDTSRQKLPFGIAQVGKAFRNEISPRDFLFRCREFEQMELEFFVNPNDKKCPFIDSIKDYKFNLLSEKDQKYNKKHSQVAVKDMLKAGVEEWHLYWLKEMYQWFIDLGIKPENLRLREHKKDELAHYSKGCFDIEYNFPFGWKEIHGNANRGCFDLTEHMKHSKQNLEYFDEESKKKIIPEVIEPSQGVERAFLAFMFDAYNHDPDNKERDWVVLKLSPKIAPIKVAILPLVNKLNDKAREIHNELKTEFPCFYDKSGAIGRRYARQDEIGTPYCVTVDFEEDGCVTVRDRDTTKQERIKITELKGHLSKLLN